MKQITQKTISRLSPLEQESLTWCFEHYQQWVEDNKGNDKNAVFVTAFVELILYDFKEGELEAFRSLRRRGIIKSIRKHKKIKGNDHVTYRVLLDECIVRAHRMLKQMQIAIFDSFDIIKDVPEGCPAEYANGDFASRHALAEWLEQHGDNYLHKGKEKLSPYNYYIYEKGYDRKYRFAVAVVPVDVSRPWFIHSYYGREKIWYLDKKAEYNQVRPDVRPEVVSYGFGGDSCVIRG